MEADPFSMAGFMSVRARAAAVERSRRTHLGSLRISTSNYYLS